MTSIKFSFYNLFLSQEGTLFGNDLTDFIDSLGQRQRPEDRTATINDVVYSMPHLRRFEGPRDDGTRFFWIGKFLTEKPYVGHLNDDDFDIMADDAYSPAMIIYRPGDHLLAIQSKQSAPRKKAVEDFLNYFLHENGRNQNFEIVLYKQCDQTTLDMLEEDTVVNYVSLDILTNNYRPQDNAAENPLANIINTSVRNATEFGSNYCTLTWRKGLFKRAISFQMIESLREIDFNNESIVRGKAVVKRPGLAKTTTIDLLTDGILQTEFNIGDGITAFEAMAVSANEYVHNNGIPQQCMDFYVQTYRDDVVGDDAFIQLD